MMRHNGNRLGARQSRFIANGLYLESFTSRIFSQAQKTEDIQMPSMSFTLVA